MMPLTRDWPGDAYLTITEAAQLLDRHPEQVLRYVRERRLTGAVKVGLKWYIPQTEVEAFGARLRGRRARPGSIKGAA